MSLQKITSEDEFKSCLTGVEDKPVFVQFSAEWCGPCEAIKEDLYNFSRKYCMMEFRYLDADEFESIFAEQNIESMPTFKCFQTDGRVDTMVGTKLDKIEEFIRKNC